MQSISSVRATYTTTHQALLSHSCDYCNLSSHGQLCNCFNF